MMLVNYGISIKIIYHFKNNKKYKYLPVLFNHYRFIYLSIYLFIYPCIFL